MIIVYGHHKNSFCLRSATIFLLCLTFDVRAAIEFTNGVQMKPVLLSVVYTHGDVVFCWVWANHSSALEEKPLIKCQTVVYWNSFGVMSRRRDLTFPLHPMYLGNHHIHSSRIEHAHKNNHDQLHRKLWCDNCLNRSLHFDLRLTFPVCTLKKKTLNGSIFFTVLG